MEFDDQRGRHDGTEVYCAMATMCVLLTNEPRAYRDTISVALRFLRPHVEVNVTDPEKLDESILLHAPKVVVCSHLTTLVVEQVPTWVVLYSDDAPVALRYLNGKRTTVSEIDLDGIMSLIDQTEHRTLA